MDKSVTFAVAGSGKTQYIIDKLDTENNFLIITYTDANYENIKLRVIQKFGCIPSNIHISTYFKFLYSFCFKPVLKDDFLSKGINWKAPPTHTFRLARGNDNFYKDKNNLLYHNRISKLLETKRCYPLISSRISKYFNYVFIDEAQDFAGHDFNFLKVFADCKSNVALVGDFYQYTYSTSNDGKVNASLHKSFSGYQKRLKDLGFSIQETSLTKSYRCPDFICKFVKENLLIDIESHQINTGVVNFLTNEADIKKILECPETIKLFYQSHNKYNLYSQNWGKSKGEDKYHNVCVILNSATLKRYKSKQLHQMAPLSKNKFYVACTRAKGNLYFIPDKYCAEYKK